MRMRTLKIGMAVSAALVLPISFVTPAFAESGMGLDGTSNVSSEEGLEASTAKEESKSLAAFRSVEAAPEKLEGSDSVAAPLVSGSFGGLMITTPAGMMIPSGSTNQVRSLKITHNGPAITSNNYYTFGAGTRYPEVSIAKKNAGVYSSSAYKPFLSPVAGLAPNPAKAGYLKLSAAYYTTPGLYKVTVPVTKRTWTGSTWAQTTIATSKNVAVNANISRSQRKTQLSGTASAWKAFPVTVTAPEYQTGGKVKLYYKPADSSSYVWVGSAKLKAYRGESSKVTITVPAAHNVAGRGGRMYVSVGTVPYAPGYSTKAVKLTPLY